MTPNSALAVRESSKIKSDVRKLVAQIAKMDAGKVRESASIRDDLGIDSLAAMEILASIEKRLGIVIDEAKAFDVVTVEDLLDLVTQCLKKKKRL
ncbi:MAG: acyl carrier protein [Candidatus Omnitrophica bacterium CG_4_9_14_0_2_um_filter_42_8]|nr:MAG: acyl carrier protein [Candidatus Omnitrophica bacterium CG22_combo_CG10-13_8_21_14_all_43_16]PJC48735.1 MAG: acyl carrier protein [Candidatus Omnitrophica bacterium CG_4_9_14_0_2_um_filter_42_8]